MITKRLCFVVFFLLTVNCLLQTISFAQGVWTKKADFGGVTRWHAVGFSIGTKGYIGTGMKTSSYYQDFWEWNQATDVWTQKANFGGTARNAATGFSIGTKGYIGTGNDGVVSFNDFWEWDGDPASPTYNTWTKKADFGGTARRWATGFSIGTKGYIGTGEDNTTKVQDFWEWDQTTNVWTKKADFGGTARRGATGFCIGTKGYIGTGWDNIGSYKQDFWEWDQATNVWIQKATFAGIVRYDAVAFSIGTKGYLGTGTGLGGNKQDFWEWNQTTDTWTQKINFGGTPRFAGVGFSIGSKGYIGTGFDFSTYYQDFWEYDSAGVTSISENVLENIVSVLPNPFSTQTTFSLSNEVKNAALKIYDLSGKEVKRISFSGDKIILERKDFSDGVYFYQIILMAVGTEDQIIRMGKIMIQ